MSGFETVPEQHEAKRLLAAALQEGPAHAYLFHGPAGVGKRELARRFAAELLGDHARVERGSHPDLYLLEPLGEQIRIDDVRELRRDLHMRPFEGERRVYLIFGADSLNEDAADALLKDLEEPPPYAVVVLVAERLGPLARDDPLPLPARSVPAPLGAGGAAGDPRARARPRRGGGDDARARLGRPSRPCAPAPRSGRGPEAGDADRRRARRSTPIRPSSRPTAPTKLLAGIGERGAEAKAAAELQVESLELTGTRGGPAHAARTARSRARGAARAARGARVVVPRPRRGRGGCRGGGRPCRQARGAAHGRDARADARRRGSVRARARGVARGRGASGLDAARARSAADPAARRARQRAVA